MSNEIPGSVLTTNFFNKIASRDPQMQKDAADAATDYIRLTLRDEGIARKIIPSQTITEAELDTQLDTDKPVKIFEKEVMQPLSVSLPFGTLPTNQYMNMQKGRVDFARLSTKNFIKDIQEVKTWGADIRNIWKDNAIKDMMTLEDQTLMTIVDSIVSSNGSAGQLGDPTSPVGNSASSLTGKVQYYDFTDATKNPLGVTGFNRDTAVEATKILQKGYDPNGVSTSAAYGKTVTPIRLKTDFVLMNVNTGLEYTKFTRNEAGGDISEKFFEEGLTEGTFFGVKHIFTLKDDIVADGVAYQFAAPQFLGKLYELESPTMFLEQRAYLLEFFIYSCIGLSIGNPMGLAKAKFF